MAINQFIVSRRVLGNFGSTITLHGFCDASQEDFGAYIYARLYNSVAKVQIWILVFKSHVTPFKKTTISRHELYGAVLLIELIGPIKAKLHRIGLVLKSSDVFLLSE